MSDENKLDPKPTGSSNLLTWKDLNDLLQSNFPIKANSTNFKPTIDVAAYEMSKEEIIFEAEKQGYKVTDGGNHLIFE